ELVPLGLQSPSSVEYLPFFLLEAGAPTPQPSPSSVEIYYRFFVGVYLPTARREAGAPTPQPSPSSVENIPLLSDIQLSIPLKKNGSNYNKITRFAMLLPDLPSPPEPIA